MSPTAPPTAAWASFAGHRVDALVTTRDGGVSGGAYASLNLGLTVGDDPDLVAENRRRAVSALGLDLADCVFAHQVHGRAVAVVGDADRGRGTLALDDAPACDALVTATPGLGLAALAADCLTLVLYDPGAHLLGVAHAGWRGTAAGVAAAAVEAMVGLGASAGAVLAALGPAIPAARYQVGDEVVEAVRDGLGPADGAAVLAPDGPGHWRLDLAEANRRSLVAAGVEPGRIEAPGLGTGPGTPYFSDRAERPCGRCAALAVLR
jgi:YfiH family protein